MKNNKFTVTVLTAVAAAVVIGGFIGLRHLNVKNDLETAKKLYQSGEMPKALEIFESVYDRAGKRGAGVEALVFLCQGHNSMENYDKSIEYARDLLSANKGENNNVLALYWMGSSYGKNKDYGNGINALNDIISKYGQSEFVDDALFELAKIKRAQGQYLDALDLLKQLIEKYPNSNLIKEAQKEFGNLNVAILFSPIQTIYSTEYVVKPGDSVPVIAKKFNTPADMLKYSNGLGVKVKIKPGDRLKVNTAVFSIIINKSNNTLTLLANGELFKVYDVGTGKMNSTPVGKFKITNKLANPPWYKPGGGLIPFGSKENLLGTRWMGINVPGYGIHGTWEPETVGKQSSAGCVRLVNSDVEELFKIVVPGTEVTIID